MEPPTYRLGPDSSGKLEEFGSAFIELSRAYFGSETEGVDAYAERFEREPVSAGFDFGTYPRLYYLAELAHMAVLNRIMWDRFCRAEHTVIFILDCLCIMGEKCKRTGEKFEQRCSGCAPNCMVKRIADLKGRYRFEEVFAHREQTDHFKASRRSTERSRSSASPAS